MLHGRSKQVDFKHRKSTKKQIVGVLLLFLIGLFTAPPQGKSQLSASNNSSFLPVPLLEELKQGTHYGRPALILSNGMLELTVLEMGGALAKLILTDDPERTNPMWDGFRADREKGQPERPNGMVGHFTCVDGFGPVSDQEKAAGFPNIHGEAAWLPWATQSSVKKGNLVELSQAVYLPRVQELFTRTIRLVEGEKVIYVENKLANLLDFDRPISWAEHATIGSPFLKPEVTVVDMSSNRAITRSKYAPSDNLQQRLLPNKEFTWPMAPTMSGTMVDLRSAPPTSNSSDWTAHLWNRDGELAFVTALNLEKRLMLGYVFRPDNYPWMQTWEYYPLEGIMARGLEFGSQAFDLPRRKVITENKIFGQLLYRWLPAKSEIKAKFILFWTRTPKDFKRTDAIHFSEGQLQITDSHSGTSFRLKASQGL